MTIEPNQAYYQKVWATPHSIKPDHLEAINRASPLPPLGQIINLTVQTIAPIAPRRIWQLTIDWTC